MLRDIPRVYLSIFLFAGLMAYLVAASAGAFERDTDMLTLNEGVLSAAVEVEAYMFSHSDSGTPDEDGYK